MPRAIFLSPSVGLSLFLGGILLTAGPIPSGPTAQLAETRIGKEPTYTTKTPRYLLLAFGPRAEHCRWLVIDGDAVYLDRDGNGDLTDEGEKVTAEAFKKSAHPAHESERSIRLGELKIGDHTHKNLSVIQTKYLRKFDKTREPGGSTPEEWQKAMDEVYREEPSGITVAVVMAVDMHCYPAFRKSKVRHVMHFAGRDATGSLRLGTRPANAPALHIGGPMRAQPASWQELRQGVEDKFTVVIATPGRGQGSTLFPMYDLVPSEAHPEIEISFPPTKVGGEWITQKHVLKQRC